MRQLPFAIKAFLVSAGFVFAGTSPAFAHHSYAMFDRTRTVTISGTIRSFEWTNPHIYIWLFVKNDKGGEDLYGVEGRPASTLSRIGWSKTMLKPGDKVTLEINPLKDGRTGGYFAKMTMADGRVFLERNAENP